MQTRFASKLLNSVLLAILLSIAGAFALYTDGDWWTAPPGMDRCLFAATLAIGYTLLLWVSWRHAPSPAASSLRTTEPTSLAKILVIYASETGVAEQLAEETVSRLRGRREVSEPVPIDRLSMQQLAVVSEALFVVSTAGEGDPPGHAMEFADTSMAQSHRLSDLRYAVLALGDSSYDEYCAFGRRLDHWLQANGGNRLFDRIEVDDSDPDAITRWFGQIEAAEPRDQLVASMR